MSPKTADWVLVAFAALVALIVVRREFGEQRAQSTPATAIADWQKFDDSTRRDASRSIAAVVVVFSDYQCPFCADLDRRLDSLRLLKYRGRLGVVVRHLPIDRIHPLARSAAAAAECARRSGKFEAYHRGLFAHQAALSRATLSTLAVTVGIVDTVEFNSCMSEPGIARTIALDESLAKKLGLEGTPVMILGDSLLRGTMTSEQLEARIDRAIAGSRKRSE